MSKKDTPVKAFGINGILTLRSGRAIVAQTRDIDEMVRVVKAMQEARNEDENWINIATPWNAVERILDDSALDRSSPSFPPHRRRHWVDPFVSLSVYNEGKKLISVWK